MNSLNIKESVILSKPTNIDLLFCLKCDKICDVMIENKTCSQSYEMKIIPVEMYIQNVVIRVNDEYLFQCSNNMRFYDIFQSKSNDQYVVHFFLLLIASVFLITLFRASIWKNLIWKNWMSIKNKDKKSKKENREQNKDIIYDADHDIFFENPRTWGLYSKNYSECEVWFLQMNKNISDRSAV